MLSRFYYLGIKIADRSLKQIDWCFVENPKWSVHQVDQAAVNVQPAVDDERELEDATLKF